MKTSFTQFSDDFSDEGFWSKMGRYARKVGSESVHKALCLWLVIKESDAPMWAKAAATGALGYFISPVDAIPDVVPGGFADDAAMLAAAFAVLTLYITEPIKAKASEMLPEWLRD